MLAGNGELLVYKLAWLAPLSDPLLSISAIYTHAHTHTLTHSHAHTRTHTLTHSHAHTHTHTHQPGFSRMARWIALGMKVP